MHASSLRKAIFLKTYKMWLALLVDNNLNRPNEVGFNPYLKRMCIHFKNLI